MRYPDQLRKFTTLIFQALVVLLAFVPPCFASAFSIVEMGVRAAGMGTAFIGVADDPSALFYNPAGISFQEGTRLQMDALVFAGSFRFKPTDALPGTSIPESGFSGTVKPHFLPLATMYAIKQLSDKTTLGFAVYTPFGLADNFTNFNDGDPALTKYTGDSREPAEGCRHFGFNPL